ncbi:hypothetical protein [Oceanispirochaeta sp.]|jgi:hypothetical protein|uniref:hypothetical protein n=1 Tax=Oceanispirochaeta sp. TaxID=2035350 RepID=UPI00261CF7AF|nr:hypothetical protein [Oceanispirochaeta sp.]MDA3956319.1 hypothetical protein [Oceanispirochaeta sp.]
MPSPQDTFASHYLSFIRSTGRSLPLPHPRWIMQYRLKDKEDFLEYYSEQLNKAHEEMK